MRQSRVEGGKTWAHNHKNKKKQNKIAKSQLLFKKSKSIIPKSDLGPLEPALGRFHLLPLGLPRRVQVPVSLLGLRGLLLRSGVRAATHAAVPGAHRNEIGAAARHGRARGAVGGHLHRPTAASTAAARLEHLGPLLGACGHLLAQFRITVVPSFLTMLDLGAFPPRHLTRSVLSRFAGHRGKNIKQKQEQKQKQNQ
jgi:hypothetical protein